MIDARHRFRTPAHPGPGPQRPQSQFSGFFRGGEVLACGNWHGERVALREPHTLMVKSNVRPMAKSSPVGTTLVE